METISHHLGSPFLTDLHFTKEHRQVQGDIVVRLTHFLSVATRKGNILVPEGFRSDGASIPKWAQKIIGSAFDLEYLAAAIVHDLLYRDNGLYPDISRADADLIFKDLLWNSKVPKWKIPFFYSAVKAFGWMSYKKIQEL